VIALALVSTGGYEKLLQLISFAMASWAVEIASYFVVRRKRPSCPPAGSSVGAARVPVMSGALVVLGARDRPMAVITSFGIVAVIAIVYALTRPKLVVAAPAPDAQHVAGEARQCLRAASCASSWFATCFARPAWIGRPRYLFEIALGGRDSPLRAKIWPRWNFASRSSGRSAIAGRTPRSPWLGALGLVAMRARTTAARPRRSARASASSRPRAPDRCSPSAYSSISAR